MKKGFLLATIIFTVALTHVTAQKSRSFDSPNYVTALGIKGYPGAGGAAVTLKHFIKEDAALEALGYFFQKGGRITGLYEFHWDIPGASGLKWYVGPGAHVGFYNDKHDDDVKDGDSYAAFGLDGVIGLDYKFNHIPLNMSLDWQPSFDFGSNRYNGFSGEFGGVSVRYTF